MSEITLTFEEESVGKSVVHSAYLVHKKLGPGLLEKFYEKCLEYELTKAGHTIERQVSYPFIYDEMTFESAVRIDLLVDSKVIVEIKSAETTSPVWKSQIVSQLHLSGHRLGFVINFCVPLIKDGIWRVIHTRPRN